jgi:Transcription factor zinc-finger
MARREKGVKTTTCPTCGNELKLVSEQDDGGVVGEVCSNCYGSPEKASKSTSSTSREKGTTTKEKEK